MTIHTYPTSAEAVKAAPSLADGDILVIPSEGIAGWIEHVEPIAATRTRGALHGLATARLIAAQRSGARAQQRIEGRIGTALAALSDAQLALEDEAHTRNAGLA
ncbi:hypothetical protein [Nocardia salmonicida]|uniref:hypothetical protein n=1 Tax=Nocardia salmonicida TaxID=53431 RepID=UPI0036455E38